MRAFSSGLAVRHDELAALWQIGDLPKGPAGIAVLKTLVGIELVVDTADPARSHSVSVVPPEEDPAAPSAATRAALNALFGDGAWDRIREGGHVVPRPVLPLLAEYAATDELVGIHDAWVPTWFAQLRWASLRARLDVYLLDVIGPATVAISWLERVTRRSAGPAVGRSVAAAAVDIVRALRADRRDLSDLCDRLDAWIEAIAVTESSAPRFDMPNTWTRNPRADAVRHGAVAVLREFAGESTAALWSWELCERAWRRANVPALADAARGHVETLRNRASREATGGSGLRLVDVEAMPMAAETVLDLAVGDDEPRLFHVLVGDDDEPVATIRLWRLPESIQVEHAGGRALLLPDGVPLGQVRLPTSAQVDSNRPTVRSLNELALNLRLAD